MIPYSVEKSLEDLNTVDYLLNLEDEDEEEEDEDEEFPVEY